MQFDLSFMRERAIHDHPELAANFRYYANELAKFFQLVRRSHLPLAMIGPRVDALWHTFILFTPQYRNFCLTNFGWYVDHQPHSDMTPVPDSAVTNFLDAYGRRFGVLPIWWLDGLSQHAAASLLAGVVPQGHRWSGWVPPGEVMGDGSSREL